MADHLKVLTPRDDLHIKESDEDANGPNGWKWDWLDHEMVINGIKSKLSEHVQKVDVPGKVMCILCSKPVAYKGRGRINLVDHVKTPGHWSRFKAQASTSRLPSSFFKSKPSAAASAAVPIGPPRLVTLEDRKINAQVCTDVSDLNTMTQLI